MSFLTVEQVLQRVDDQRRDDGDSPIDDNKKFRALNAILKIVKGRANWKFAIRSVLMNYLTGYSNYSIENVLGLTDFKDINSLRIFGQENEEFEHIEADEFSLKFGRVSSNNLMALQWKEGTPVLRINRIGNKSRTQLHAANEIATNGAWSADATTDAENIAQDSVEFVKNSASIKFDIDIDQSANDNAKIKNSTLTAVNLSDYEDIGSIRMWVFVPSGLLTSLSSLTLYWGSASSIYWSGTVIAPADGGSFVAGWNEIQFDWIDASESGSPTSTDAAAIDFLQFQVDYASTLAADVTGVRISDIWAVIPEKLELFYYSTFLAKNSSGTRIENISATTDKLMIPERYQEVLVEGTLWQLMDQMGSNQGEDSERHRKFFGFDPVDGGIIKGSLLHQMIREVGINPIPERRKLRIRMRRET